jgi:tetratricopeptide (TPR) repeat protein
VTLARTAARSLALAIALASIVTAAPPLARDAHAQKPSDKDLEAAKEAFAKGKASFEKGNFGDAVEFFKESYRLSKNPLLLFNIGITFERLMNKEMAVFYYKKFLEDAPADAAQRADAEKSLAALEGKAPEVKPDEVKPDPEVKKKKEPRTTPCTVEEVQHQIVEDAPPGKPLDLTAFVPDDCGWTVNLYFRGAGEEQFTTVVMRPRYNELVARIPQEKMAGNAVQYYVEFKNEKAEVVHKIGKSTSPNVVYIDEQARPRYYPDLEETVGQTGEPEGESTFVDEEDPLTGKKRIIEDEGPDPGPGPGPIGGNPGGGGGPDGFTDVGSSKFGIAKWTSTGVGAGMLGLSVTFYIMASSWASSLEGEAQASVDESCPEDGGPPCRTYDDYRKGLESTGERYETLSKVTFTVGVLAAGVAGYFWYKEFKGKKKERVAAPAGGAKAEPVSGLRSLIAAPVAGDDFIGGAAAIRF